MPHAVGAVCVAPWVSLELDPSGLVYGCCANQTYPLGRIGEQRLTELWGGPRARVLREALARDDLSVGCASCRWHLEHGRTDPDAAVYDRYPLGSPDPAGPVAMTFALSNRCNLACVMCTPELSSTLRHRAGLPPLRPPYDDEFFDDLATFLPGLRYAKFLGGEPFLIPEHHRVWDLMAEVGAPPRLQVTTNGTIWNDRVEMVLDTFLTDVTVSFDAATAGTYEAIRDGSEFATVVGNMRRFADRARTDGTEFRICFCLMDRNWHELSPFLDLADELGAEVSINVVSDPGLALHDLPTSALREVADLWGATDAPRTERTAAVWRTQLAQLDAVLAERTGEAAPGPRQVRASTAEVLALPPAPPAGRADLGAERSRIDSWAGGGEVAEVRVRADGTVAEVVQGHGRLGIGPQLEGRPVTDLLGTMTDADGRPAWIIDVVHLPDALVRTLVLSATQPERGAQGSVVRTVLLGPAAADGDGTWSLLVAEDRFYDRPTGSVPVSLGGR